MRALIILLLVAIGGGYSYYHLEQTRIAALEAERARLKAELKKEQDRNRAEAHGEESILAGLNREKAAEQQEVDRLTNELRARENLGFDPTFREHQSEEKKNHQAVQRDLEAELARLHGQETDLNNDRKQAELTRQVADKAHKDSLSKTIQDLSGRIDQTHQTEASVRAQIGVEKEAVHQADLSLGSESRSEKDSRAVSDQLRAQISKHQAHVADLDARIRQETVKLQALGAAPSSGP